MSSRKAWLIIVVLTALVALLLGVILFVFWRPDVSGLGYKVAKLEGIRWLLEYLHLGPASAEDAAQQWLERGTELEQEGRFQEAIQAYEQARKLAPEEPFVWLGLASAHEQLGQREQALSYLEKAASLAPEDPLVLRHLGRLYCQQGQYATCVETLKKALRFDPQDAWTHYWLAGAYHHGLKGRFREAEAHYLAAIRLDPSLGDAHLGLAQLYMEKPGKEAEALEAYRHALALALETKDERLEAKARAGLATLYYGQDRYDECINEWQRVLEINPEDSVAHRRLGFCYAMRGQEEDLGRAVVELEQALVRDFPFLDAYYFTLGQYYAVHRDYPRALWAWEQFLRFSTDDERNALVQEWMDKIKEAMGE